jgi:DNA damage-binding protein 1
LITLQIDKSSTTLAVVDSITNLAPIIDFCLVDLDKRGQSQVVACCGAHKDGSLRIIRNGIGIEEIGELGDMNGINGLFTLRKTFDSTFDSIMAISFVAETRFQIMNEGVLEELENTHGLISDETTLLCANVYPNSIVQVIYILLRLRSHLHLCT